MKCLTAGADDTALWPEPNHQFALLTEQMRENR